MKVTVKKGSIACLVVLIAGLGAGCGSSSENGSNATPTTSNPTPSNTPELSVTVKIMGYNILNFATPDYFKKYVQDPVKKKYPNISVEFTSSGAFGQAVASGETPDLFFYYYANLNQIANLNALAPLDPLMKKNNFNQSTIAADAWDSVKNLANSDKIMAMPIAFSRPALFYNKDIFDKFGVAYPKSGMTFQQASELGKKMNQTVDGVRYIGFHPQSIFRLEMQRNLPYLDPKSGKFAVNTDDWAKLYTMLKTIYQAQNIPDTIYTDNDSFAAWGKGQIAMLAAGQGQAQTAYNNKF